MKVTILGSGTSHGVPMVGCGCVVCVSADQRNKRLRASILVEEAGSVVVVDTSTDFRTQALRAGITRLDAILLTHAHADHLHGLDDTRSLARHGPIPLYAALNTLEEIKERFGYIFRGTQQGGGKPRLELFMIGEEQFRAAGILVQPIPVEHGSQRILGFRFGPLSYVTDCSAIPERSMGMLAGTETLILGALRHRPHTTHFSIRQALDAAEQIGARRTIFTHMCHDVDHGELLAALPDGVEPGYDGMVVETATP